MKQPSPIRISKGRIEKDAEGNIYSRPSRWDSELKLKEKEITSSVTQGQSVMHSPDSFSPKLEHMCNTEAQKIQWVIAHLFCYVAMFEHNQLKCFKMLSSLSSYGSA